MKKIIKSFSLRCNFSFFSYYLQPLNVDDLIEEELVHNLLLYSVHWENYPSLSSFTEILTEITFVPNLIDEELS